MEAHVTVCITHLYAWIGLWISAEGHQAPVCVGKALKVSFELRNSVRMRVVLWLSRRHVREQHS